jgi:hypothetical protein
MITKMPSDSSTRFLLYRRLRRRLGPTSQPPFWQGSMILVRLTITYRAGAQSRACSSGVEAREHRYYNVYAESRPVYIHRLP